MAAAAAVVMVRHCFQRRLRHDTVVRGHRNELWRWQQPRTRTLLPLLLLLLLLRAWLRVWDHQLTRTVLPLRTLTKLQCQCPVFPLYSSPGPSRLL
jgi:hypothetical protein